MSETEAIIVKLPDSGLHGRRKIFTNKKKVTRENVVEVVGRGLAVHRANRSEIQYLWDYFRGKQDIRNKSKVVRPEINNKVTVNRANEIVTFKTAYLLGEPLQYVSIGGDTKVTNAVNILNAAMRSEEKNTKDKQIVDWMHICGIGVRMVLPDQQEDEDGSPASIFTLDPRDAFVIYYSGIGHLPKAGVVRQKNEDGEWISCVYTIDTYYEIKGNEIINGGGFGEPHGLGRIPIIEYANNDARMGAFEPVLSLLNAINTLESNRVDSVEDFVNAFDVFQNCEIDTEKYSNLSKGGKAIMIACTTPGVESKVYRITSELNQSGTQTIVDDVYDAVLTICGMPNRNGGSSTSDTGAATIMRDGWQSAESRAQDTEKMFVCSEREFLRQFLFICRSLGIMDLKLSDIEVRFTRRRYDGLQSKAQVFAQLYATGIVDPYDIYAISELFPDSGAACARGLAWKKQNDEAAKQQTNINSSEVLDS